MPAAPLVDALVRAVRQELLDGSDAVVPGLGRFSVTYLESAVDEDVEGRHVLRPPQNTVTFSPQ